MNEAVIAEEKLKPRERRDSRENRQRLLEVAKELFHTQGVEATSMVEIARAAAVGQGTLYRHFTDKGDLCRELIKEDITAFCERLGSVISGTWVIESPLARIDMLISEKIRLTESHLPLFAEMEAAGGAKRPKPARGPFHTWVHEQIVALLQEAIECGEISELDIAFTADAILAAVAPPIYSSQRNELGYSSERIIAGIRHLFIAGLRQR
jgi:AcrR family transcriptional regulator